MYLLYRQTPSAFALNEVPGELEQVAARADPCGGTCLLRGETMYGVVSASCSWCLIRRALPCCLVSVVVLMQVSKPSWAPPMVSSYSHPTAFMMAPPLHVRPVAPARCFPASQARVLQPSPLSRLPVMGRSVKSLSLKSTAGSEASQPSNPPLDTEAVVRYVSATALQWGAIIAFMGGAQWAAGALAVKPTIFVWLVRAFFAFMSLR